MKINPELWVQLTLLGWAQEENQGKRTLKGGVRVGGGGEREIRKNRYPRNQEKHLQREYARHPCQTLPRGYILKMPAISVDSARLVVSSARAASGEGWRGCCMPPVGKEGAAQLAAGGGDAVRARDAVRAIKDYCIE